MKLTAVLTRDFLEEDIEYIRSGAKDWKIVVPDEFSDKHLVELVKSGVDVLIGTPPSRNVLISALPKLKLLQIPWTGLEQLDFSDCIELDICVANSHGNSYAVAEMAFSLIMSTLKRTPYHDSELRNREWHRPGSKFGFFAPELLRGKRIGYFGYGQINKALHQMLSGFQVEHIAISRTASQSEIDILPIEDLELFLWKSDIIVIAAPLTTITEGIFDQSAFNKMNKGAIIINVARARIIKEQALIENLESGHIAGVGLDVWYQYPSRGNSNVLPCDEVLLSHANLVASPHRSGFVKGELPHLDDVVKNLRLIQDNQPPLNLVNLKNKY